MDAKISQTRPRLWDWRICAWNSNLRKNSRQDSESKNFEELEYFQYLCKVLSDTGAGSKNFWPSLSTCSSPPKCENTKGKGQRKTKTEVRAYRLAKCKVSGSPSTGAKAGHDQGLSYQGISRVGGNLTIYYF